MSQSKVGLELRALADEHHARPRQVALVAQLPGGIQTVGRVPLRWRWLSPRTSSFSVMLMEPFRRLPDIAATAEPEKLRSNFIRGIKRLPVAFKPA